MKAIVVKEPGGAEQLSIGEYPKPETGTHELLVRIKACAVNRADILQRKGKYPPPTGASPILGLDIAGVVEERGAHCRKWRAGDNVCGLISGGGYAEFAVIHEDLAMPFAPNLSFEEAAAIPEVFLTAYQVLFWLGNVQKEQFVLIHAGASGVGTAAIQLAREAGAHVIATVGHPVKVAVCRGLGAVAAFNYNEGPFVEQVMAVTNRKGATIIMDFIGASFWEQNLACIAEDGYWILISAMGGAKIEQMNLLQFMQKRIHMIGTTLRARSLNYRIRLAKEFVEYALPRFINKRLKPIVDRIVPWHEVQEAHRYVESNASIGKVVLTIS